MAHSTTQTGARKEVQYTDALGKHTRYVDDISNAPAGARQIGIKPVTAYTNNKHNAPNTDFSPDTPRSALQLARANGSYTPSPVDTSRPSPQTTQVNPPNSFGQPDQSLGYDQAQANLNRGLSGNTLSMATQSLKRKYGIALDKTNASGTPPPPTQGAANTTIQQAVPTDKSSLQPESTQPVDTYFQENPVVQQSMKETMDFLSPPSIQKELFTQMRKITKGQNELAEEQMQLMNKKRIMEGTPDDIRSEIQAAGGIGTESQINALAIGRNKTLLKEATFLQDQMQLHQDSIANDVSLLNFEKEMANSQFNQRMSILQYQQQNYKNSLNAAKDQFSSNINLMGGVDNFYKAIANSPQQIDYYERLNGLPKGGLFIAAQQAEKDRQFMDTKNQLSLGGMGGGMGGGVSNTTQAIINNPNLFDDLTSTEKGKVITQLQAGGYDTSNLGLKGLSDSAITSISQTQKALDDLNVLKTKIQGNEDKLGPIKGLAALNPWSSSRKLQADVDRVRQTVGKALEGGVLRKEDEDKYKKILATLLDTPSTAYYKIDALIGSITRDIENYKSLQQSAGRSLNVSAGLQKSGQTTNQQDLRKKYNY